MFLKERKKCLKIFKSNIANSFLKHKKMKQKGNITPYKKGGGLVSLE
jgi:hypothetical protein